MKSRNHMKMQIFVIFLKNSFKINMIKMKNIVKLRAIVIIQMYIEVLNIAYVI